MSVASLPKSAGVHRNRLCAPVNVMKQLSPLGTPSDGQRSKKARQQGQTIVWVDEAGFYLLAGVVRTYAPRGQTPVLRVPLSRDHLAAISGITEEGQSLMKMQEQAFHGVGVVGFLKHLRRHIKGK